jgi:hypothetical protein
MKSNPVSGETFRFTFSDGPMANKTFEHVFDPEGTVTFRIVGGDASPRSATPDESKNAPEPKYEVAMIREDLAAVSYLGTGGYTLTTILDFKTKKLVSFSSNETAVSVQHGTFEYGAATPDRAPTPRTHG